MRVGCSHLHLQEAHAKDEKQADLLPPSQLEADDKGDRQEKDHEVGDDVGICIPDLDFKSNALSFDRLVPHSLERDAVDEGCDEDPDAARSDESQHDVVADARPTQAEEASVQQQNR